MFSKEDALQMQINALRESNALLQKRLEVQVLHHYNLVMRVNDLDVSCLNDMISRAAIHTGFCLYAERTLLAEIVAKHWLLNQTLKDVDIAEHLNFAELIELSPQMATLDENKPFDDLELYGIKFGG
ncbi:MAG: hypothetical protein ACRCYY_10815 [Trueperaceae bacterium]